EHDHVGFASQALEKRGAQKRRRVQVECAGDVQDRGEPTLLQDATQVAVGLGNGAHDASTASLGTCSTTRRAGGRPATTARRDSAPPAEAPTTATARIDMA